MRIALGSVLFATMAIVGLEALAYAIVLPHLPIVVGNSSAWWTVGLLFGGYSLMQLMAIGPIGGLAERYGVIRVTAGCLVGTAVGLVLTALSTNYWVLLAGRLIDGASAGTVVVVTASALSASPREQWTRVLGFLNGIRGVAGLVGIVSTAVVGVVLADPVAGLQTTAWAGTGVVLGAVLIVSGLPPITGRVATGRLAGAGGRRRAWRRSHVALQAAQSGLVVLAPGLGAEVASMEVGLAAPAAAMIGLAIGQAVLAERAEDSAVLRLGTWATLMIGGVILPWSGTVLAGFAMVGLAIGTLVPRIQGGLIRASMDVGASDMMANVDAGRSAVVGQILGPVLTYGALSLSPMLAAATLVVLVAVASPAMADPSDADSEAPTA